MRTFQYMTQDAAIYFDFPYNNTGADEQLEIGKYNGDGSNTAVRSLVQFDVTVISASLANGTLPLNTDFTLTLYISNAQQLNIGQNVEFKPVSQSWLEGDGFFWQQVTQSAVGASWNQPSSGSIWATAGGSTQSISISQSFTNPITDVAIDVTPYVLSWVSGTYPNNGLLVKFLDADETNGFNLGNVKFFSRQTHTIYQPTLAIKWNDQLFSTGSLSGSPTIDLFVMASGLKPTYRLNEITRVDLAVRSRYPLKTFDTVFSNYTGMMYLPTSSYYSVVDEVAGTTIIPFDQYSLISASPSGTYFNMTLQGMYPLRTYRVLIRVDHDGVSEIFDNNSLFTISQ